MLASHLPERQALPLQLASTHQQLASTHQQLASAHQLASVLTLLRRVTADPATALVAADLP